MKPFLGIDLTTDKKNEQPNGDEFLIAKPSAALTQSLEDSSEIAEETIEKSQLPLPVRIVHWICGVLGVLIAVGIIKALVGEDGISLSEAYQNAAWLFWLGGACLSAWVFLKFVSICKENSVLETDESEQVFKNVDASCETIFSELNVPPDAKEIDILAFFYKKKGDDIKLCEKGWQSAEYINLVFRVFADSENLYFANLEGKYAIPLSAIKAIKSVKKAIHMLSWNKDEDCNKGIYKQYKLSEDNYGGITCKSYYILEFEHSNELWGVYIPCYELPIIEEVTGFEADPF